MKKLFVSFIALLSFMLIFASGCSAVFQEVRTANIVEKTYDFKDFTNVELSDAVQFEVIQSDSFNVVVSTQENNIEQLDIFQSGNTLHIGLKFSLINHPNTRVTVTLPQLNKLEVSGSCRGSATGFDSTGNLDVAVSGASRLNLSIKAGRTGLDISGSSNITGDLTSTDTQIELSGASDLNMNLQAGKIGMEVSGSSEVVGVLHALDSQFKLSGASDCELTGSAGNALIEAFGSSKMNSPGLNLQSADVKLEGASRATIYTDGALNIDVSGASTLDYTGNASVGNIEISEASKVNHN